MRAGRGESGRGSRAAGGVRGFLENLAALAAGMLLFAGAFPNVLNADGFPFLAWAAYAPVFWVISRSSLAASVFWGALYGCGAYSLFNSWLSVFHPLAGLIVGVLYLVYMAVLFPLLKAAALLFPKKGYLLQFLLWMSFEYLRTLGFLGYAYGITGYSQWGALPLIQIASVFGVWGVSALVVFPSVWLGWALSGERERETGNGEQGEENRKWKVENGGRKKETALLSTFYFPLSSLKNFFRREWPAAAVWGLCLAAALVYGVFFRVDYTSAPKVTIALIQHNTDPWRGGIFEYGSNFRVLKRLSDEAMSCEPKPDLVVWSETAFVPRIYWHTNYRDDPLSWKLVKELLDYLAQKETPFVIGNDDARRELTPEGVWERVDYNGAMLFEKGVNTQLYRKLRLVPFTEHFPYRKQFPWIYQALVNADTHFWEKGDEAKVFSLPIQDGKFVLQFSTPICFEDTFGYLSRDFVRNGAELIVNLSNDAWSRSLPAQMQHLSMAVFRAVENRRAMVRATASGQTCGIDPNGKVLAMAAPFIETALTVEVPVLTGSSGYGKMGDALPLVCACAAAALLMMRIIQSRLGKSRNERQKENTDS
ncbi:MAG: apolipoprotein N-acyltransferase [Treponematales bacterium]